MNAQEKIVKDMTKEEAQVFELFRAVEKHDKTAEQAFFDLQGMLGEAA